jgi:hypothetical protein
LKYGWTYHDGETFGIEQIQDENLQFQIQWLKEVTGQHGGDWTTRVHVTPQVNERCSYCHYELSCYLVIESYITRIIVLLFSS